MTRLAGVGAGSRGRSHLAAADAIDGQECLLCENDANYPHSTYHEFTPGAEIPEWAENVSDRSAAVTATTLPDHDRLADAASAASSTYFVGFTLRSAPFYTRLKSLLEEGRIGDLGMVGCRECRGYFTATYCFSQERSGGVLLNKNCHDFDLYNWYVDADPVAVTAYGGQHVHTENTDINDHSTVIVRYDDGTVGTLELRLCAPFGERTRMYELRGSAGILRAPEESGAVDLYTRETQDRLTVSQRGGGHAGADTR